MNILIGYWIGVNITYLLYILIRTIAWLISNRDYSFLTMVFGNEDRYLFVKCMFYVWLFFLVIGLSIFLSYEIVLLF